MCKYLLILLLLASCGKDNKSYVEGYTTPELNDLVAEFEDTFDVKVAYPVLFVSQFTEPGQASQGGACYKNGERVEISETLEGKTLQAVVFHELGHCSLHAKHYNETLDIMNSTLHPFLVYQVETVYIPQMLDNYLDGKY